jgi:hypothetical protein
MTTEYGDVKGNRASSLEVDKHITPVLDFVPEKGPGTTWQGVPDCTGLVAEKYEVGAVVLRPVRCHSWACAYCGYTRASWLKRQVSEAAVEHELSRFMTLTLGTRQVSRADSEERLKLAWSRLRKVLHGVYPGLEYVWVMEYTKWGQAHLHLLVNTYIPQRVLSRLWKEASGGSYIVDIRQPGVTAVARYIAKYVGKEAGRRRAGGLQRVNANLFGTSRGIVFQPYRKKSQGWVVVKGSMQSWKEFLRHGQDRACVMVERGSALDVGRPVVAMAGATYPLVTWEKTRRADPLRAGDW